MPLPHHSAMWGMWLKIHEEPLDVTSVHRFAVIGYLCLVNHCLESRRDRPSAATSIRPNPPCRFWYQPQFVHEQPTLYPHASLITAMGDPEDIGFWTEQGVAVSRWAYGLQSPHSQGKWEYYRHE